MRLDIVGHRQRMIGNKVRVKLRVLGGRPIWGRFFRLQIPKNEGWSGSPEHSQKDAQSGITAHR